MVTISNVLEHWATIYKPLHHDPNSAKLEDQSFFRIRDIDEENIFTRNANQMRSPLMLYRVVNSGELKNDKQALITYQAIFLTRLKDTAKSLGRFDGNRLQQASDDLMGYCEDLASYLTQLRRTQVCPITGRNFKAEEPKLGLELSSIDIESFAYGVNPLFRGPGWLLADCYFQTIRPLYNFQCEKDAKYAIPAFMQDDKDDATDNGKQDATDKDTADKGKEG